MPGNRVAAWSAIALLSVLFLWGLEQVAVAPLETGEVYPPYSSLRSDPLGAKALYESLSNLEGLQVTRLYKRRTVLEPGSVLLVLGVDPRPWSEITQKTLTEYEDLVAKGGRLVLAFLPVHAASHPEQTVLLQERWGVQLRYVESDRSARSVSVPRYSDLYMKPGDAWKIDAAADHRPSIIERPFGAGSIVLVSQSYQLSNEGLREERDAQLLADILGGVHKITFDEDHFGIEESGSVTTLMRKYHLEPAVAVLLITAILFLWRSSSSLLPPKQTNALSAVAGRDAQEGLVSLLERSLPEKELLDTCYAEWTRTAPGHLRAKQLEAEIARGGNRTAAEIYRAASRTLNPQK